MNFLVVVVGTIALGGVLFLYRPGAHKMLSASRWMVLAWGFLTFVHFASPIVYHTLRISFFTWLYCGLWIATFVLSDSVRFTLWNRPNAICAQLRFVHCSTTTLRFLSTLSLIGAVILIYTRLHTLSVFDTTSLLADVRETQLSGDDIGLTKTITTVLACCGLLVALVDICNAICTKSSIPLRAGVSLLAYLAVTVATGGRPGFVLATLSVFIAVFSSIYLSGFGFSRFRSLLLFGALMTVASLGYLTVVVSSRSTEFVGDTDRRYAYMNTLWNCELEPKFRESLKPLGTFNDTISDSFYYISPQFYGLDYDLRNYHGPFTMGGSQFHVVARHIENLFGTKILDAEDKADTRMFQEIGFFPHFFRTAVDDTFKDFGMVLSIPYVYLCGVMSRRSRTRALLSRAPFSIALQSLICSGIVFSIIGSPFCEQTFYFPLMWFIGIQTMYEVVLPLARSCHSRCVQRALGRTLKIA